MRSQNNEYTDVYIPTAKVKEILIKNGISEIATVKSRWKENSITKCDSDRYDCKYLKRRCIHFVFEGDSILKDFDDFQEKTSETPEVPVSTMKFDDDAAVAEIFGVNADD